MEYRFSSLSHRGGLAGIDNRRRVGGWGGLSRNGAGGGAIVDPFEEAQLKFGWGGENHDFVVCGG